MRKQRFILVGGLVVGLIGAGLVLAYVRGVESRATAGEALVPVLIAQGTIDAGTPGTEVRDLVRRTEVPGKYAAPGAISDVTEILSRFAVEQIERGETLTESQFAVAGATKGRLPIPKGKEAVAIAINLDPGVASYVAPGDFVSIYSTFRQGGEVTMKILSNIEVLSTQANPTNSAQRFTGSTGTPGNQLVFVLAVTPEEAAKLIHARQVGSLWFTLVPQGQRSEDVPPYSLAGEGVATESGA